MVAIRERVQSKLSPYLILSSTRMSLFNQPMFVMTNDGGLLDSSKPFSAERILCQRLFLFDLLAAGIAVTLLQGAEFRDSKASSTTR